MDLERNLLFRETGGDGGGRPRLIHSEQPDVITTFVHLHRRFTGDGQALGRRRPNGATWAPRAISPISATTAEAVASPPAPGPTSVMGAIPSASSVNSIGDAHHLRDRGLLRHHGGMHPLLDTSFGLHRNTEQLDTITEFVGRHEIGRRDRRDAFDIDRDPASTLVPNAIDARIASFCAVSNPSTSNVGSASA